MSIAERARMFGCTVEQICSQYRANAADLDAMAEKAERTGKKVNGYTAVELRHMAASMRHEANRA